MDWGDLPFFLAVARAGQIGKAAAITRTDATTVGRRIRRLEIALGNRLFEQGPQGQRLTLAGQALLARAEQMSRIADGIGGVHGEAAPLNGSIRVSVSEGFGTWFVSPHLGDFATLYPGITVDLVATSGFLNPTRRETDIAVMLARPPRGPLKARKLVDYDLQLYASRDYVEHHAGVERPQDIAGHRFIGYVPDIIYAPQLHYLDELPQTPEAVIRSSSINAQHRMIAAGAGIGILPNFIARNDASLCVQLPDFRIERSFWLVTHHEMRGFPIVATFIDWLVALVDRHRREF